MWVTPEAIDAEQFTHRRLRGGYDETEVDDFLDLLAGHVGEMQDYISRLEAELDALREGALPKQGRGDEGISGAWPAEVRRVEAWPVHEGVPVPGVQREDGSMAYHEVEAAPPVGPYPELSPDRLDATNGGRPTNVPRPERVSGPHGDDGRHAGSSPGVATGTGPGHPFDPIASWQLPVFVPLRTLADEIAEDAEEYLRSEAAAKAAREDPDPRVWQTFQDARRAAWCQRVGLDLDPIEWTAA